MPPLYAPTALRIMAGEQIVRVRVEILASGAAARTPSYRPSKHRPPPEVPPLTGRRLESRRPCRSATRWLPGRPSRYQRPRVDRNGGTLPRHRPEDGRWFWTKRWVGSSSSIRAEIPPRTMAPCHQRMAGASETGIEAFICALTRAGGSSRSATSRDRDMPESRCREDRATAPGAGDDIAWSLDWHTVGASPSHTRQAALDLTLGMCDEPILSCSAPGIRPDVLPGVRPGLSGDR